MHTQHIERTFCAISIRVLCLFVRAVLWQCSVSIRRANAIVARIKCYCATRKEEFIGTQYFNRVKAEDNQVLAKISAHLSGANYWLALHRDAHKGQSLIQETLVALAGHHCRWFLQVHPKHTRSRQTHWNINSWMDCIRYENTINSITYANIH